MHSTDVTLRFTFQGLGISVIISIIIHVGMNEFSQKTECGKLTGKTE